MKNICKRLIFGLLATSQFFVCSSAWCEAAPAPSSAAKAAQPEAQELSLFKDFDYPELQVVPRASDRVASEAQSEEDSRWTSSWPLQISALSTLATGLMAKGRYASDTATDNAKKEADNAAFLATGIGAGWFGLVTALTFQDPYRKSLSAIKKMKSGDKRSDLFRERMAEETLEKQAKISKIVMYSSVISNMAASIYVAGLTDKDAKNYAYTSVVLSVLPLLFQSSQITTYEKHQEYKRKIYTPLSWIDWNPKAREWSPQVALRVDF